MDQQLKAKIKKINSNNFRMRNHLNDDLNIQSKLPLKVDQFQFNNFKIIYVTISMKLTSNQNLIERLKATIIILVLQQNRDWNCYCHCWHCFYEALIEGLRVQDIVNFILLKQSDLSDFYSRIFEISDSYLDNQQRLVSESIRKLLLGVPLSIQLKFIDINSEQKLSFIFADDLAIIIYNFHRIKSLIGLIQMKG